MRATLTGIRPSLWARCPTAAVFQGRGEEEAPHPPEAEEYFFRGQVFEEIVMRQIAAKHGRENVERQVTIPIPGIGEGHADGYLIPEKTLIEIKSTVAAHPNSDIFSHGVKQLKIYLAHHPEAEQGALYMLNPNRMTPADVYTVKLTGDDRDQIDFERDYIVHSVAVSDADLVPNGAPERPCTKPSQARGRMCPFARVCFDGWEEVPAAEITDPLALDAVSRLAAVKAQEKLHKDALKALEEGKTQAQAELEELLPAGKSVVGPFEVSRSDVQRSPAFSLKAAQAAGFPVEALDEFMRPGASYSTFRVTKAAEAGDVDYGEVPFE